MFIVDPMFNRASVYMMFLAFEDYKALHQEEIDWLRENSNKVKPTHYLNTFRHKIKTILLERINRVIDNIEDASLRAIIRYEYNTCKKIKRAKQFWAQLVREETTQDADILIVEPWRLNGRRFKLESHLQQILALSHVLILGENKCHDAFRQNVLPIEPNVVLEQLLTRFEYPKNGNQFPNDIKPQLRAIVGDFVARRSNALNTCTALTTLASEQDDITQRIITSIGSMVNSLLPSRPRDLSESQLQARYLNSFLSPLLDSKETNQIIDWKNRKQFADAGRTKNRPDAIVGGDISNTIAFIEVKTGKSASNHYAINFDLYRLGEFGAQLLDKNHINNSFSIMAIGGILIFFMHQRVSKNITLTLELEVINIPMCYAEIPNLLNSLDELYNLLEILYRKCYNVNNRMPNAFKLEDTLSHNDFRAIVSVNKNTKRENPFFYG